MTSWMGELRFSLRLLRRRAGWSMVVILSLALGMGGTGAIFSLVYAALLRPLPFADTGRLVWVSSNNTALGLENQTALSARQIADWGPELGRVFSDFGYASEGSNGEVWRLGDQAATPFARRASGNLFSMLGVRAQLGRLLRPDDTRPGHGDVVVLSDEFWRRVFSDDPHVVGKKIQERDGDYGAYTVIGVLPPEFHLEKSTDIWLPAEADPQRASFRAFYLISRRRAGVEAEAVQSELAGLEARQPAVARDTTQWAGPQRWTIQVTPLRELFSRNWERSLLLMLAAAGSLLLLACVNVVHLLLGRGWERRGEIAVRLALGCAPWRLARQLLTESAVLALAGAGLGYCGAGLSLRFLAASRWLPPTMARATFALHANVLNSAVVAFALAVTAAAVLTFGLAPVLQARRGSLARNSTRGGAGPWLAAGEAAVAMTLVIAAGVLAHSFANLAEVEPGFQPQGRVGFRLALPITRCFTAQCAWAMNESAVSYLDQLMMRLRALPGIEAVGAAGDLPFDEEAPAAPAPLPTQLQQVFPNFISAGYFAAAGTRLIEGRDFDATDVLGRPKSLIVNESFARRFFPGQDIVGRRIRASRCGTEGNPSGLCTVIGVVEDVRDQSLALAPRPEVYESLHQDPNSAVAMVLRSRRDPRTVTSEVEALLRSLPEWNGQRPYVFPPASLDQSVAQSLATPRFRSWLAELLASLGLLLAGLGIYGVQSHAVARRRQEIGVRMALGADRGSVFRLIVGEALGWTLLGAGAGLALGLAAARGLHAWLYGVSASDPLTLALALLLLSATTAGAAYAPARRAMAVDPAAALREDSARI